LAVRLSVVMVHSPPPSAVAQRKAEQIVGELIGRPGIDLTLVGPLRSLTVNSTDRLTLESLTGDVAVLDWSSPIEIAQSLASIGFTGHRAPHRDDPDAPRERPDRSRRIYAFDLSSFRDATSAIDSLEKLKAEREVRTFSLSPTTKPVEPIAPVVPTVGSQLHQEEDPGVAVSPLRQQAVWGLSKPKLTDPPSPEHRSGKMSPAGSGSPKSIDLDDLLDQLDELDP
jgi:hypothetical protein